MRGLGLGGSWVVCWRGWAGLGCALGGYQVSSRGSWLGSFGVQAGCRAAGCRGPYGLQAGCRFAGTSRNHSHLSLPLINSDPVGSGFQTRLSASAVASRITATCLIAHALASGAGSTRPREVAVVQKSRRSAWGRGTRDRGTASRRHVTEEGESRRRRPGPEGRGVQDRTSGGADGEQTTRCGCRRWGETGTGLLTGGRAFGDAGWHLNAACSVGRCKTSARELCFCSAGLLSFLESATTVCVCGEPPKICVRTAGRPNT